MFKLRGYRSKELSQLSDYFHHSSAIKQTFFCFLFYKIMSYRNQHIQDYKLKNN